MSETKFNFFHVYILYFFLILRCKLKFRINVSVFCKLCLNVLKNLMLSNNNKAKKFFFTFFLKLNLILSQIKNTHPKFESFFYIK